MKTLNPNAEIIWTAAEISLLAETKRVCEVIKGKESRLDLLFLSAGYAPFGKRRETGEGLEVTQSLEYYSRILFIQHLLPLLNRSETPRVISVLGGGMESANIDLDDLQLKKPGRFPGFGGMTASMLYVSMGTMALETLAGGNPGVAFVHSWPGWVSTGSLDRSSETASRVMGWFVWLVLGPIVWLMAMGDEEAGQRHLFLCTSAKFGGSGVRWEGKPGVNSLGKEADGGLFLVNYKCECTPNAKAVSVLREKAMGRIWEHTQEILRPYL